MQQPTAVKPAFLTPKQLAAQVGRLTATPAEWVARVRLDVGGRWCERIHRGAEGSRGMARYW